MYGHEGGYRDKEGKEYTCFVPRKSNFTYQPHYDDCEEVTTKIGNKYNTPRAMLEYGKYDTHKYTLYSIIYKYKNTLLVLFSIYFICSLFVFTIIKGQHTTISRIVPAFGFYVFWVIACKYGESVAVWIEHYTRHAHLLDGYGTSSWVEANPFRRPFNPDIIKYEIGTLMPARKAPDVYSSEAYGQYILFILSKWILFIYMWVEMYYSAYLCLVAPAMLHYLFVPHPAAASVHAAGVDNGGTLRPLDTTMLAQQLKSGIRGKAPFAFVSRNMARKAEALAERLEREKRLADAAFERERSRSSAQHGSSGDA